MELMIKIDSGTPDDVKVLKNIFSAYDIRTEVVHTANGDYEMGGEFVAALLVAAPLIIDTLKVIVPVIKTYIETRKPSGTNHRLELINGDKKIAVTNEDGRTINVDKLIDLCNETNFFD